MTQKLKSKKTLLNKAKHIQTKLGKIKKSVQSQPKINLLAINDKKKKKITDLQFDEFKWHERISSKK